MSVRARFFVSLPLVGEVTVSRAPRVRSEDGPVSITNSPGSTARSHARVTTTGTSPDTRSPLRRA
ncbi:hypothetical protein [Streptomyces sp. NBC_01602]|uniref:hypothetical protein n=1 Tax=Streptomyces sp. NBC_01602 TaxID=2975893 RepID=UPI00386BFAED